MARPHLGQFVVFMNSSALSENCSRCQLAIVSTGIRFVNACDSRLNTLDKLKEALTKDFVRVVSWTFREGDDPQSHQTTRTRYLSQNPLSGIEAGRWSQLSSEYLASALMRCSV